MIDVDEHIVLLKEAEKRPPKPRSVAWNILLIIGAFIIAHVGQIAVYRALHTGLAWLQTGLAFFAVHLDLIVWTLLGGVTLAGLQQLFLLRLPRRAFAVWLGVTLVSLFLALVIGRWGNHFWLDALGLSLERCCETTVAVHTWYGLIIGMINGTILGTGQQWMLHRYYPSVKHWGIGMALIIIILFGVGGWWNGSITVVLDPCLCLPG